MHTDQNRQERLQRLYSVELPPAAERRMRLVGFADDVKQGTHQLYSREHMPLVQKIRDTAMELRPLCQAYGELTEDRPAILACAQSLQSFMVDLATAYPVMASAYYQSRVTGPLAHLISELNAPLPTVKAAK